jgi:hypothetical protein
MSHTPQTSKEVISGRNRFLHFITSLIATSLVPLMPMLGELIMTGGVQTNTVYFAIAMMSFSVGLASPNVDTLILMMLFCMSNVIMATQQFFLIIGPVPASEMSVTTLASLIAAGILERIRRHLVQGHAFTGVPLLLSVIPRG